MLLLALPFGLVPVVAAAPPVVLTPCPDRPNCVSTDLPGTAPIRFDGEVEVAQRRLREVLAAWPRARIVVERPGFIAVEFRSRLFGFVDAAEFAIEPVPPRDRDAPAAAQLRYRSGARSGYWDFGVNRERLQALAAAFAQAR